MADKKKKSPARNLLNSGKKKLIIESAKNVYPDDTKSKNTFAQSAIEGNPKKAIKKSIDNLYLQSKKSGKSDKLDNQKSVAQAVLTGTSKKAIKGLIQESFRLADEKHKALNKEYRKERNNLIRRIAYFKKQGFEFNTDAIAPQLDGNATRQQIQRLHDLRGKNLRNLAIGFTPPQKTDSDDSFQKENETNAGIAKIVEAYSESEGIPYTAEMFESDYENYVDTDFHPTFDDLVYDEEEPIYDDYEEIETPQERYYKENKDRIYAGDDAKIKAGESVLQNAWRMIEGEDMFLSVIPMKRENKEIKAEGAYSLSEMLSRAEDSLGHEALSLILEKHAAEFNYAVDRVLKWRDSTDIDLTRSETSYSLTKINNILFSTNIALLTENSTGNPEDV